MSNPKLQTGREPHNHERSNKTKAPLTSRPRKARYNHEDGPKKPFENNENDPHARQTMKTIFPGTTVKTALKAKPYLPFENAPSQP